MGTPADEMPEIRLDEIIGERANPRPTQRGLVSEDTARELRRAAEELANAPEMPMTPDVSVDEGAPPVFPSSMSDEPLAVAAPPVVSEPEAMDLDALIADLDRQEQQPKPSPKPLPTPINDDDATVADSLAGMLSGTDPKALAASLPPVVAPADDPLAPQLPLSMEEPPPVTRIAMEQLMPDPQALEALRRLAGAAGNPERTRSTLQAAFAGNGYDPRHLPDARVMLMGIARVLVDHGLPADEMVEAIMASLTD